MNENKNSFFIVRLFRGEYSLPRSYWLFCAIPVGLFGKLISLIRDVNFFTYSYFILVAYHLIAVIGVWRSANKYEGWKVWPFLAKFVCILAFLTNLSWAFFFLSLTDDSFVTNIFKNNSYLEISQFFENSDKVNAGNEYSDNEKIVKSFDECVVFYAQNSTLKALELAEVKCDEMFPVVDLEEYYHPDMFDYRWYCDFWNTYLILENIRTEIPITGCTGTIRFAESANNTDSKHVDVFFSFSSGNNTSSIMTLEDTSLFQYLDIKKIHYRGRSTIN